MTLCTDFALSDYCCVLLQGIEHVLHSADSGPHRRCRLRYVSVLKYGLIDGLGRLLREQERQTGGDNHHEVAPKKDAIEYQRYHPPFACHFARGIFFS